MKADFESRRSGYNEYSWLTQKEPVWLFKNSLFIKGIVQSIALDSVVCMLEDGGLTQTKKSLVFQRNPAYKQFDQERWDLMDTDVLNEPEILKTLKLRLQNSRIYTYVEDSLISVNPYTPIPLLYSEELKKFYLQTVLMRQQSIRDVSQYEPHLYAMTAHMLSQMGSKGKDQAMIISGESGAGKTEANKECLRFLQFYFKHQGTSKALEHPQMDKNIENVLSLSTPILQAFGNAKTIRNNNSSRFGKYLSVSLELPLRVRNARIYNYLLQKSRIINRAQNEQNFHIFYQLLGGLTKAQKNKYHLLSDKGRQYRLQDFAYLRSSSAEVNYQQHPDVSFDKVKDSLNTLQGGAAYDFVCRVLSAILLLGNLVPFQSEAEDRCHIQNEGVFKDICDLLKVQRGVLLNSLVCYKIAIGSEVLTKYFNSRQVQQLINSLSKILYEKLFQWIINQINLIGDRTVQTSRNQQKMQRVLDKTVNIGFLDIYGFQLLQNNSLEQLFINYTNQRLHQIYIGQIFEQEAALFENQGLKDKFKGVQYADNRGVLQLLDYDQLSVLNLLEEWCVVASPDDSSFITKIRHKHKKHASFPTSNFNMPGSMFVIKHTPKNIQYNALGFREKNKDLVRSQIKTAIASSQLATLSGIFREGPEKEDPAIKNHKFRKFLSYKFRHQINSLVVDILGKSRLHFVRCVKPNNFKQPLIMEDEVTYNQICYLGVLDTIRLKKMGYSIKLEYKLIDDRFPWLVRTNLLVDASPIAIQQQLRRFLTRLQQDDILFGKNLVMFRDYAYTLLNKKYQTFLQDLHIKAITIQRLLLKNKYLNIRQRRRKNTKTVLAYFKSFLLAQKHQRTMRSWVKMQRLMKGKIAAVRQNRRRGNILVLQAYVKKEIARRNKAKVLQSLATIVSCLRKWKLRKTVQKLAIINQIKDSIMQRAWKRIALKQKSVVQRYLKGFLCQVGEKAQIMTANRRTVQKFRYKYTSMVGSYIVAWQERKMTQKMLVQVRRVGSLMRGWLYRQKYLRLKKAAIVIQRAYREYYFNKNTASHIFNLNFGQYKNELQEQNHSIRNFLYQNSLHNSIRILYKTHLAKFTQKCSIFYFAVDFQTFLNMELCYPDNSWLLNYFTLVRDSLEKDNPIQSLQVAQTFTLAATTNRLYIWGLNQHYETLEKISVIKPQGQTRIERAHIEGKNLQITYELPLKQTTKSVKQSTKTVKETTKIFKTVNRSYQLEGGQLKERKDEFVERPIRLTTGERVLEVTCGSSHVILRTSSKRVLTMGNGRSGQLGHGNLFSIDTPKALQFAQLKHYPACQVSAAFNSSVILLSNRKIYWFGSNGTLDRVTSPVLLDLNKCFPEFGEGKFAPLRIVASWSRSLSVIGVTLIRFAGKLAQNFTLRNKIYELMVTKWQQKDIGNINPPFQSAYADYLEECHVKLPLKQVNIQPESKKNLKKFQEKVSLWNTQKQSNQFSFSDPRYK